MGGRRGCRPPIDESTISSLAVDPSAPATVYAGTGYEGSRGVNHLNRSEDGGATWRAVGNSSFDGIRAIVLDPANTNTAYAAGNGVLKSVDGGLSWQRLANPNGGMCCLAIHPVVGTTVYAGGSVFPGPFQVFKTTDGGASWTPLSVLAGSRGIGAIVIDPLTPSTMYLAGVNGVLKSTDDGATWQPAITGLTTVDVTALVLDPLSPSTLYAGTNGGGVFRSTNGAASWAPYNEGLTTARVTTLAIAFGGSATAISGPSVTRLRLYAGTDGGGLVMRQPPVPAFDGDSRADLAVYRHGTGQWFVANSSDGTVTTAAYGDPAHGDVPIPGDYDGDGRRDLAFFRPSTGKWHMLNSGTGHEFVFAFGVAALGDMPVPADYNGDGRTDLALYRTTTGEWFVGGAVMQFGAPSLGDVPVPADYDGDGKADIAVYRTSTGEWFIFGSSVGFRATQFGAAHLGDVPVPADYDGDGARMWRSTGPQPASGSSLDPRPASRARCCSERHTSATCQCRRTTTATARLTSRCTERAPASGSALARLQAASVRWRSAIPRSATFLSRCDDPNDGSGYPLSLHYRRRVVPRHARGSCLHGCSGTVDH